VIKATTFVHKADSELFNLAIQPPVQEGICHFNLTQYNNCDDPKENMFATIVMTDSNKLKIASQLEMQPINNAAPWDCPTPFGDLKITGEHKGDYVQFNLGDKSWRSTDMDTTAKEFCTVGPWDAKIPNCNSIFEKNPTMVSPHLDTLLVVF
jgi:hypothetical protein